MYRRGKGEVAAEIFNYKKVVSCVKIKRRERLAFSLSFSDDEIYYIKWCRSSGTILNIRAKNVVLR